LSIILHTHIAIYVYTYVNVFLVSIEPESDNSTMGKPYKISCKFSIDEENVNLSWTGPNINDSKRITVNNSYDDHINISTLQFLYISGEDENAIYTCTATLPEKNESFSKIFTFTNKTSKFPFIVHTLLCVHVLYI